MGDLLAGVGDLLAGVGDLLAGVGDFLAGVGFLAGDLAGLPVAFLGGLAMCRS